VEINLFNSKGMHYLLTGNEETTKVHLVGTSKEITINLPLAETFRRWFYWQRERLNIQDVFPELQASEREFFITGITRDEWTTIFGNSETVH
jgi:hypothetical protein